jgi:DNA invertase Pin-like site-specific DNA recombinase
LTTGQRLRISLVFSLESRHDRQTYALRQRAIALGWPDSQIITIDTDHEHSAASTVDREGFQRLVAEVGMGKAGIVLGLEVSRLARNNANWHRLLEICALRMVPLPGNRPSSPSSATNGSP